MKAKKSTWLPLLLLVYLMVMAYVGRGQVAAGKYRSDGRVAARNRAAAFHAQTQRAPQKAARER